MQLPGIIGIREVDPHHLQRYLLPHEEPAIITRHHPAILLRHVGETVAGLILAGLLSALVSQGTLATMIWLAWLLVLARLAVKVYEWSDDFFAVTSVRVMLIHGIATRRVDMMPLSKITDLTLNRSMPGRLLGYGAIVLESAGQDQALSTVHFLPEPEALYLQISAVAFGNHE